MASKLDCAAAFVPAAYDYGPFTKPVTGFGVHMAEGNNVVAYLDNKGAPPQRGVSVHFVVQENGRIVQMLDIRHACGGLNPDDRSHDKGFYGPDVLRAVLGAHWDNPNAVSIQVELEGFAREGPTLAQTTAMTELANELRARIPSLRGSFGHADQTDTKWCPGRTSRIFDLFEAIGGHGVWEDNVVPLKITTTVPTIISAKAGRRYDLDGRTVLAANGVALVNRESPYGVSNGMRAFYGSLGGNTGIRVMLVAASSNEPVPAPEPPDTTAAFNAGVAEATRLAATATKP